MAGAMRKMGVYLGLVEDQDRYDEYDERYDAYDPADEVDAPETDGRRERRELDDERPVRVPERRPQPVGATARPERMERVERVERGGVATLAERRPAPAPAPATPASIEPARITTLHPRTYNEARTIGEHFRDGTPVIMNLSEMDDGDAKRLVDFAAGLVFGARGTIERVTSKVFLLSPADVVVAAEDKARIAENGFFNQS